MIRIIATFAAVLVVLVSTSPAAAQQTEKVWRIGTLFSGSPVTHGQYVDWFRQGLKDLGYEEGRNYVIESHWAMGERKRIRSLATKIARSRVDVILVNGGTVVRAVGKATKTIPIVVGSAGGLGTYGLVASLSRPGGNVTGSAAISHELGGKRLQLLKELVPGVRHVAYLYTYRKGVPRRVKLTEAAARSLGIEIQRFPLKGFADLDRAFAKLNVEPIDAIFTAGSRVVFYHRNEVLQSAKSLNIPFVCGRIELVRAGCLMAYLPDRSHLMRRAASYVDQILKGAKPADLPVEEATKFDLVINLKTAKALGITVPPSILLSATEVIK